ncbi:YSIRK-type signal peptide-containing protein [Streptococcus sp. 19428wC2_LYSM12]|uniref:Rib/alpha-like domain-containing protein n=3 Tax=Streptococcus TaxID=1301 RepID=UPI001071CC46|nr:Rib/alpha-like domain-containing protein [Streptococcus sp. 19428wC2_LYSM12]MBF0786406.1 YSIRK-type signal peptide-containing protein [Streptococcus sp. 19428wC2_LYSM12]TFV06814.1 YSIRK-type signal peptide-containing protein [Streptococcus sp. LYSM12]
MKNRHKMNWYRLRQRFSIRKYHFGVASVLLGTALLLGTPIVQADEEVKVGTELSGESVSPATGVDRAEVVDQAHLSSPTVGHVSKSQIAPVTEEEVLAQVRASEKQAIIAKEIKGLLPTTVGLHQVPVEVTYADDTKETVIVPVEITDVADKENEKEVTLTNTNKQELANSLLTEEASTDKPQTSENRKDTVPTLSPTEITPVRAAFRSANSSEQVILNGKSYSVGYTNLTLKDDYDVVFSSMGPVSNRPNDLGLVDLGNRRYLYLFDFGNNATIDYQELRRRVSFVPKGSAAVQGAPTIHGTDIDDESKRRIVQDGVHYRFTNVEDTELTSMVRIYGRGTGRENAILSAPTLVSTSSPAYYDIVRPFTLTNFQSGGLGEVATNILQVNGVYYTAYFHKSVDAYLGEDRKAEYEGGSAYVQYADNRIAIPLIGVDVRPPQINGAESSTALALPSQPILASDLESQLGSKLDVRKIIVTDNVYSNTALVRAPKLSQSVRIAGVNALPMLTQAQKDEKIAAINKTVEKNNLTYFRFKDAQGNYYDTLEQVKADALQANARKTYEVIAISTDESGNASTPTTVGQFTVSTQAAEYTPNIGSVTKPETDSLTPQDVLDQVTAPNGTQFTDKQVKGAIPTTVGMHDVPVEVTYPDGTKEIVTVPVEIIEILDKDKYEPRTELANIQGSDAPNSPLSEADKDAIKAKVDTTGLPQGTTLEAAGTVGGTVDNPVVEVTVTYPDGTTDTVNVPVKQKDNEKYQPTVHSDKALIDSSDAPESTLSDADKDAIKAKVDPTGLPQGTVLTPADKVSGTPDNPVVEVTVTYPDGTTDTLTIPVKQKDKEKYQPTVRADKALIDSSDAPESTLSEADKEAVKDKVDTSNLPQGTVLTPADKVSGTSDNPVVQVTVTYPDGTTDTVNVPVKQKDNEKYQPTVREGKALIDSPDAPESTLSDADKDAIKAKVDTTGLPQGTVLTPANKVSGTPDNPVVQVTVTYPDGTTDTLTIPVKQKDKEKYQPTVRSDKALIDSPDTPNSLLSDADKDAIKAKVDTTGLPQGTTLEPAGTVGGTVDNPVVQVTVTYPDGTTDTLTIPVKQKDKEKYQPTVRAGKALIDSPDTPESTLSDADKDTIKAKVDTTGLPQGTTLEPAGTVGGTVDNPVVEVTVTYPDGTTDTLTIPVKQKDSATNAPTVKPDKDGTPAVAAGKVLIDSPDVPESTLSDADKEAVKDKVDTSNLPQGTVLTPADKVSGTPDNPVVEVTVTYPDGTTDTLTIPVKQKDSATNEPRIKADDPNTPAVSAGKVLIDSPDAPESTLSEADKEAVKDKVDTSNLPQGTVLTPADKVSGTPDNPVVQVTVTYPDGTTDTLTIPVKQKDSATNAPTVKPDKDGTPAVSAGKVLIDSPDVPESTLSEADKEAVKDKVDTSNLPQGTVLTPADKVSGTSDNPVVEVTVTYPDGTTDTVNVPVKQKDNEKYQPTVREGKALIDSPDTPNSLLSDADKDAIKAKVDTTGLPQGTTLEPAGTVGGTVDNPVVQVTVTYPDGTTDTLTIPVKQKDKEKYQPTVRAGKALIDSPDTPNSPLSDADKDAIKAKVDTTGLPQGTTLEPAGTVGGTVDNPVVEVTVTYPDGTTDTLTIPVKQKDSVTNAPTLKPDKDGTPAVSAGKVLIDSPDAPESTLSDADKEAVKDKVDTSNLPQGTVLTPADKVSGTSDNPVVQVTVTYPDGTTDTLTIPVKQKDSATNAPTVKPDKDGTPAVSTGKVLIDSPDAPESTLSEADKEAVKDKVDTSNLPQGTVLTPADKVSGTPDNPVVQVTVTYPDGTTDTLTVPVKQKDSASKEPTVKPDKDGTPAVAAGKVLIDSPDAPESTLSEADKEAVKDKVDTSNLPQGTVLTPADKVSGTPDNPVVQVTVTYPDGTTDTLTIPVKQKDKEKYQPTVRADKALIDSPDTPNSLLSDADKDAIKAKVDTTGLPQGTTLETAGTVGGTVDNPVVEVTVTYPDGTTDTLTIPVKQKDSATNEPRIKADDPNTPAASAGKVLIDSSDAPESTLSEADKEAVKDKVDTSNLPQGTVLTPADKVSGTPETPVVQVTVTYPDGTTDTLTIPVKQKDKEKYQPTVRADKALIDSPDTPNSPLSDADKDAIKAKVDPTGLPQGTVLTPADKVSGTPDNPVVQVTVTYPDGTTDTLTIPVKQKDKEKYQPTVRADKTLIDSSDAPESTLSEADKEAVKDKVDTSNLPQGTVLTPADKVSGTPDNPVVQVTVTYPDGTTDTLTIPVKQKDKEKYQPTVRSDKALIDSSDAPESTLSEADKEAVKDKVDTSNLPQGTVLTPADKVSGTPDNPVVQVTVTYPDGTTDTLTIPVKQKDKEKYQPTVRAGKALIDSSDAPESTLSEADKEAVKDKVDTSNLPQGTMLTPADKVSGTPDNPVVQVTVTYPDGTTDTLTIPVKQKDSATNAPTVKPDKDGTPAVAAGKALIDSSDAPESTLSEADKEAVKDKVDTSNLPQGTVLTPADKVSGTPDNPVVQVTVTYPDGTTDTLTIPVKQKDSATNAPTVKPDKDGTPAVAAGKVLIDSPDAPESTLSEADKEAVKDKVDTSNLPQGTVLTPADKVSGTPDNPVVQVTVTYPDGTTGTLTIPVKQKDSMVYSPQLLSLTEVDNVNQITDDEKVRIKEAFEKANPHLPAGTKILVLDKGSLAVLFPDGSEFEIDGRHIVIEKTTPAPLPEEKKIDKESGVQPMTLTGQDPIASRSRKQGQLPNTGESSVARVQVAGLLTIFATSLFWLMGKGRKEEE